MTVVALPRKKLAPPTPRILHEDVTREERAAAYELLCRAQALQRLFDRPWITTTLRDSTPALIAEARQALDALEGLVG